MEEMNETMEAALENAWEEDSTPAAQEEPGQEERAEETTEELFTLKNRDETRQVNRQELIAMAQKGWDYDNVRQERDQLRQYRQTIEQLGGPARAVGRAVETPRADALLQRARANARRQDMERFLSAYPAVKAESIPREVWGQVARGVPLVSAYAMHENQQLRVQLNAQRQDQINRARTPGGLGANVGMELDELDRMWNEDD